MDFSEVYLENLIVILSKSKKDFFFFMNSVSAIVLANFKVSKNKLKGFMKVSGKTTNFTVKNGVSSQNYLGKFVLVHK